MRGGVQSASAGGTAERRAAGGEMEDGEVLALVDDLIRLARASGAARIEVETEEMAVAVSVDAPQGPGAQSAEAAPQSAADRAQQVRASTVGIFGAARDWSAGDAVQRGAVLGSIQSLGHMAEITSPADGEIAEVLVTGGAPVEYGQPLFVITPRPA